MLALRDTFALEICKLSRASSGGVPILQTLCSLRLPTLLSGQQIADIRLSQSSTLSTTHPSFSRRSLSAFPFRSDPNDDILAFEVYFRDNYERRIIFVARRCALLSLATPSGTQAVPPTRAWEDWGPRTTHWMELDPLNDSISLSGSRCALVKYSHLRNHYVLDLRDFNPYRFRARSAQNKSVATAGGVASLTVLSAQACFEEDVVSELPFWSIRKENVGRHVLLDDEWIGEILVRRFGVLLARPLHAYIIAVADSGTKMSKRRSLSSIQSRLRPSYSVDRMFYLLWQDCLWLHLYLRKQYVCHHSRVTSIDVFCSLLVILGVLGTI